MLQSRRKVPGWPFRKREPIPLTGAPAAPRRKTYSAQSGYVYNYTFQGRRPVTRAGDSGDEYVFEVAPDAKTLFPVSVFVAGEAVSQWEAAHRRELTSTERYAIAKMALFQAFDERSNPGEMREEICVRPADVEAILETLGID
jgi:hypothetical protein